MCEQCVANAKLVISDVVPGFSLMVAEGGSEDWPKGWYGLVECNDPTMVFPTLEIDPLFGVSVAELDTTGGQPEVLAQESLHLDAVMAFQERVPASLMANYRLVSACFVAGYDPELHGTYVESWLIHHMASKLAK